MLADGRRALSWGGELKLWDLHRGDLLTTCTGHGEAIIGAMVLDGGGRALSWSHDCTLRLWDLTCGAELGLYYADASICQPVIGLGGRLIFAGDRLGRGHFVGLAPPASSH
jgi:WD40 repeat protein